MTQISNNACTQSVQHQLDGCFEDLRIELTSTDPFGSVISFQHGRLTGYLGAMMLLDLITVNEYELFHEIASAWVLQRVGLH